MLGADISFCLRVPGGVTKRYETSFETWSAYNVLAVNYGMITSVEGS